MTKGAHDGARALSLPAAWQVLVPLWEHSTTGWFAFSEDGLLRYANRAVAELTQRRPCLGSADPIVEVLPAGRRAIQQRWDAVRSGSASTIDSVVPAHVGGEARPLHLHVVAHEMAGRRWLVGTLRPVVLRRGAGASATHLEHTIARVMAELLAVVPPRSTGDCGGLALSVRQREILDLVVTGASTAMIADRLSLSPHTVRNHLKTIFRTFDVHSRSELITRVRGPQVTPRSC